jgi:aryl-alcohol dehydrogenase-like predicted oxidoreductase
MQYRTLGKTGLKVSELCLGAMTFGRETTEADSYTIMDRYAAAGGNFIDTADVYSRGISEDIVGKWLQDKPRDDYVIATKVRFPMGDGPNEVGLSRKHILASVEASLRRLQTDYLDLYQVHCWDPITPLKETLSTLNRSGAQRQGALHRREQLCRVAAAKSHRHLPGAFVGALCLPAAAV